MNTKPWLLGKIREQNAILEAKDKLLEMKEEELAELRDRVTFLETPPVEPIGFKEGDLVNWDGKECVVSGDPSTTRFYMVTNLLTRESTRVKEAALQPLEDLQWHECTISHAREYLAKGKRVAHPNSRNDKSLWYELGYDGHVYHVSRKGQRDDIEGNLRVFFQDKGTWYWSEKIR